MDNSYSVSNKIQRQIPLIIVVLLMVACLWILCPWFVRWAASSGCFVTDPAGSVIGDQYGLVSSLFSGLAFAALTFTLLLQLRQVRLQHEELHHSVRIQSSQIEMQRFTAMLSSLPELIHEEKQRLVRLGYRLDQVEKYTIDDILKDEQQLSDTRQEVEKKCNGLRECIEQMAQQIGAGKNELQPRLQELKNRLQPEEIHLREIERRLVAFQRLRTFLQDLENTYDRLKTYR